MPNTSTELSLSLLGAVQQVPARINWSERPGGGLRLHGVLASFEYPDGRRQTLDLLPWLDDEQVRRVCEEVQL